MIKIFEWLNTLPPGVVLGITLAFGFVFIAAIIVFARTMYPDKKKPDFIIDPDDQDHWQ